VGLETHTQTANMSACTVQAGLQLYRRSAANQSQYLSSGQGGGNPTKHMARPCSTVTAWLANIFCLPEVSTESTHPHTPPSGHTQPAQHPAGF